MEAYAEQQKELSKRPKWIPSKTKGAVEPSELIVTNVNQTKKLVVSALFYIDSDKIKIHCFALYFFLSV